MALTCSGTYALTAAVIALGIGPGDEVLVPAHTYMATAMAVLAAGAIPVIVDVDESITIDPAGDRGCIGPRTKAVIPVHMWGAACDMDAIMEIAARHDLLVLEDTCQGIGGGYEGRKLGTIGHAGAFSFNYYKNMTAGEGGGGLHRAMTRIAERARCAIDPCHFYWQGRERPAEAVRRQWRARLGDDGRDAERPARPPARHDRGDARREEADPRRPPRSSAISGCKPSPMNSPDHDCAAQVMYLLPSGGRRPIASSRSSRA